ncbi:MAG: glycerol kinase GlpK [Planctomycetota bacterium]|jgi:glycerol kinase
MTHVLALDQGTTSSRAIVFDEEARIINTAQREFTQLFPHPGWVEHDANEIWATQRAVAIEAVRSAGLGPADIGCIGITNQRETTVVWDRATGEPIHNAIVWQDRRTAGACDLLRDAGHADAIRHRTGLVLDAYFSGTKIAWLLDTVPGARDRAARGELAFGTIESWLVNRLTNGAVHVTDVSNASRTMLLDLATCSWDERMLELLNVPSEVLPTVVASAAQHGVVRGIPELEGIPITGLIGDQQSALFGQLCTEKGEAKNTYGTGCFLLVNAGPTPPTSANGLLATVGWKRGDTTDYAVEGSVFIGGALIQWLRDGLRMIDDAAEVEDLARTVDDSGGVVLVPAFAGLGAPHWDQYARGTIIGLTRGTTRGHIARAALDAIALQVADLAEAMAADAGAAIPELAVDGGAAANDLLLQTQADIMQIPIVRPTVIETTALGAALLAGLQAGVYHDIDELRSRRAVDRRFEPSISADAAGAVRSRWLRAVDRARAWEQP